MLRNVSSSDLQDHHRINFNFMKKIPPGAEASNILVGEVDFLTKTLSAFIRLNQAVVMGDLTEVPVPTRYLKIFTCFSLFSKNFLSNFTKVVVAMEKEIKFNFLLHQIYFRLTRPTRQSKYIPRNRTFNGDTYVR